MATKTWTNSTLTAADLNTYLQQRDAWDSWTPSYTNMTAGTGPTVIAKYNQIGRIVHFEFALTLGTTPSVSGLIGISSPVAAARSNIRIYGELVSAATAYVGYFTLATTGRFDVYAVGTGSTYAGFASTAAGVPNTWVAGDAIRFSGTYEAAAAP